MDHQSDPDLDASLRVAAPGATVVQMGTDACFERLSGCGDAGRCQVARPGQERT